MTASRPTIGAGSGQPSRPRAMMTLGSSPSRTISILPALNASIPRRTISTFSCDIAYLEAGHSPSIVDKTTSDDLRHPSVAQRDGVGERQIDAGTAASSSRTKSQLDDDTVFSVLDSFDLNAQLLPGLMHVPPELGVALTSPINGIQVGEHPGRVELGVRVEGLEEGIEIVSIPAFDTPAHNLQVLLRHRLLREADGFEGFGLALEQLHIGDLAVAHRYEHRQVGHDLNVLPANA